MPETAKSTPAPANGHHALVHRRAPLNEYESAIAGVATSGRAFAPRHLQATAGNAATHAAITGNDGARGDGSPQPGRASDVGLSLGEGEPLPAAVRTDMEARFNDDLTHVRIHTEAYAASSVEDRNANAYAVGRDIAFAPGHYDPTHSEGRRVLAHELAHVLQQTRGGGTGPASTPSLEGEADAAGNQVAHGGSAQVTQSAAVGVACDEKAVTRSAAFYQTAYYMNRSWATGKGVGVKKPEGWPVDTGLAELWATIDHTDQTNAPKSAKTRQFVDFVCRYQTESNLTGSKKLVVHGAVDWDTAAALRIKPFTRTGVTVEQPKPLLSKTVSFGANLKGGTSASKGADGGNADSLGSTGDFVVDTLAGAVVDGELKKKMVAAALRGFIGEMRTQLTDKGGADRFNARLAELKNPRHLLAFGSGYTLGALAGLVSPVTDLVGLAALADVLPKLGADLIARGIKHATELGAEADAISRELGELNKQVETIVGDLIENPDKIYELMEALSATAVRKSNELGHGAAAEVVDMFESPWQEPAPKEEKSLLSVLPQNPMDIWNNPVGSAVGTAGRAFNYGTDYAKGKLIQSPWQKVGFAIGKVIGMVVVQVLLLIFSGSIGNVITKASAALAEMAPFLKSLATAGKWIVSAIGAVDKAIATVAGAVLKPLEPLLKPLGKLMQRVRTFLRRLLGLADEAAAPVVSKAGTTVADELGGEAPKALPPPTIPAARPKPLVTPPVDEAAKAAPKLPVRPKTVTPPDAPVANQSPLGGKVANTNAEVPSGAASTPSRPEATVTDATGRPRKPSPYKFKEGTPEVTQLPLGKKPPTKPPTVPNEQQVIPQDAQANVVSDQVRMKEAAGYPSSHGMTMQDATPVSPRASTKLPSGAGSGNAPPPPKVAAPGADVTPISQASKPPSPLTRTPKRGMPSAPMPKAKAPRARRIQFLEQNKHVLDSSTRAAFDSMNKAKMPNYKIEEFERAYRDALRAPVGEHLDLPVRQVGRRPVAGTGAEMEEINQALRTGEPSNLDIKVSTAKPKEGIPGEAVQMDDFDPSTRTAFEYKASKNLDPYKPPAPPRTRDVVELIDRNNRQINKLADEAAGLAREARIRSLYEQMERQARFAAEVKIVYDWPMHSQQMFDDVLVEVYSMLPPGLRTRIRLSEAFFFD